MEYTKEQRWDDEAQNRMAEIEGDEAELLNNPEFLPAIEKIAKGLSESKIDWDKVEKIELPF